MFIVSVSIGTIIVYVIYYIRIIIIIYDIFIIYRNDDVAECNKRALGKFKNLCVIVL